MADHSELKRLAEACGNLNWRFQQESWTEYAIRDDHGYIATMRVGSPKQAGPDPDREAKAKFLGAMTPAAVLALIAENEALKGLYRMHQQTETREMRDLKAEIAGLKTGYEAYEQVNTGLKAEVEKLRKSAPSKEVAWCSCGDGHAANSYGAGFMDANDGVCANCDAAMGKGGQS